jgi:threonine aldolase
MANEIAMHILVRSGHLVVCEATSHVASVEVSSAAVLSGIAYRGLHAPRGQLTAEMVGDALQPDPYKVRAVDLVALENTHQVGGGTVMPIDEVRSIRKVAQEAGVPVYMDGARIFNASVASGTPVEDFAAEADAMMFCLSKGLGAPIGSVLCGTAPFIEEARRAKVLFGGAWRQAGVVAAAGLVALEEGPKRLQEDHANARRLAEAMGEALPGAIDVEGVETNMVWVDTAAAGLAPLEVRAGLADRGVLVNVIAGRVRLVTHRDVTPKAIEETIRVWRQVVASARGGEVIA